MTHPRPQLINRTWDQKVNQETFIDEMPAMLVECWAPKIPQKNPVD